MLRRATAAAAAVVALAVLPASAAAPPVAVTPRSGTPSTVFHVQVAASFPVRDPEDTYWFRIHGPGGMHCETTITERVGITPTRDAKKVFVDLPGVRVIHGQDITHGPWCRGTFTGLVTFRDWHPETSSYVDSKIGTFKLVVRRKKA
jgi:hypothetical protein